MNCKKCYEGSTQSTGREVNLKVEKESARLKWKNEKQLTRGQVIKAE
jgi:hypothetical protein